MLDPNSNGKLDAFDVAILEKLRKQEQEKCPRVPKWMAWIFILVVAPVLLFIGVRLFWGVITNTGYR